jgi:circadian clock protein KaiB
MNYVLRLYVMAQTPNSTRALANIKRICEEELDGEYELEVVDVLKNPQLAEDDKIIATPTLVKKLPPPLRRLIGDLSNRGKVLLGLDIVEPKSKAASRGAGVKSPDQKDAFQKMEAVS